MLTKEPTAEMLKQWRDVWKKYKHKLEPNRKSGQELLEYLQGKYTLTEIFDENALRAIHLNVTQNPHLHSKLPDGKAPVPRAFYLKNTCAGVVFYQPENADEPEIWDGKITKIFVGIDTASGFYMVEGSTLLWDELCAFQGLSEDDIQNPYCVAEYISCLKRFGMLHD